MKTDVNLYVNLTAIDFNKTMGVLKFGNNIIRHLSLINNLNLIALIPKNTTLPQEQSIFYKKIINIGSEEIIHSKNSCEILLHQLQKPITNLPYLVVAHDFHIWDVAWKYGDNSILKNQLKKVFLNSKSIVTEFPRTYFDIYDFVPEIHNNIFLCCSPLMMEFKYIDCNNNSYEIIENIPIAKTDEVILYPAQLQQHKNHINLIKAFKKVNDYKPNTKLICTGSFFKDDYTNLLKRLVKELNLNNKVFFTGLISDDDLKILLNRCNLLAMPSLAEGGAYVPFEGICFSKNVVCSSIRQVKLHLDLALAENIPLFDPNDINDIYEKLLIGLMQPQDNSIAREEINSWSWESTAAYFYKIISWIASDLNFPDKLKPSSVQNELIYNLKNLNKFTNASNKISNYSKTDINIITKWERIENSIEGKKFNHSFNINWGKKRDAFYENLHKKGLFLYPSDKDKARLTSLKNKYKGKRIFVIGNGPSINSMPLDLLKNEYTFVVNRAYLLFERISWRPDFYTANDTRVVPDISHEIDTLQGITCFYDQRFRGLLREDDDKYWYAHHGSLNGEDKLFSTDMVNGVRGAGSVIGSAIQISFHLGFEEIYLIGCDLGYKVNDSVKQEGEDKFGNGVKLFLTSTKDDDPNHFDPRYFGKDKKWHDPNVKRMIDGHIQCKNGVEKNQRKIFNATVGGNLEVYPRIEFTSLFKETSKKEKSLKNNLNKKYQLSKDIQNIIGPFSRSEEAHIDETNVIASLFRDNIKGKTMIDVGAHRGISLKPFLEMNWEILAFEPDNNNRKGLENLLKNHPNKDNVIVDNRCVSNSSLEDQTFYTSDISSGISGLSFFDKSHKASQIVATTTLSEAIDLYKFHNVDFLKIDTEGFDLFVLEGFPWNLFKPNVVECEFENIKTLPLGYSFHDIASFLIKKGYEVYVSEWHPIIRYGIKHNWRSIKKYPTELSENHIWGNLIAFKNPIDEECLKEALLKNLTLEKSINNFTNIPKYSLNFANNKSLFNYKSLPEQNLIKNENFELERKEINNENFELERKEINNEIIEEDLISLINEIKLAEINKEYLRCKKLYVKAFEKTNLKNFKIGIERMEFILNSKTTKI